MTRTRFPWLLAGTLAVCLWLAWLAADAPAQIVTVQPGLQTKTLTDNTATTLVTVTVPNLTGCALFLTYSATAADATNAQTHMGTVALAAAATSAGAVTATVGEETEQVANTTGTNTDTWATTTAANSATIRATFDSTLNVATTIKFQVVHSSGCAYTFN